MSYVSIIKVVGNWVEKKRGIFWEVCIYSYFVKVCVLCLVGLIKFDYSLILVCNRIWYELFVWYYSE